MAFPQCQYAPMIYIIHTYIILYSGLINWWKIVMSRVQRFAWRENHQGHAPGTVIPGLNSSALIKLINWFIKKLVLEKYSLFFFLLQTDVRSQYKSFIIGWKSTNSKAEVNQLKIFFIWVPVVRFIIGKRKNDYAIPVEWKIDEHRLW